MLLHDAFEYLERELRIAGRIFSRYVALSRVAAYAVAGWRIIGSTLSPHDGQCVAIMEWTADKPLEPGEDYVKYDFDAHRLARKATS